MDVGMDVFRSFQAGGTGAAGIGISGFPLFAVDVLRKGECHCQIAASFGTEKKLRMAHAVFCHAADKLLFYLFLPYDVTEIHRG